MYPQYENRKSPNYCSYESIDLPRGSLRHGPSTRRGYQSRPRFSPPNLLPSADTCFHPISISGQISFRHTHDKEEPERFQQSAWFVKQRMNALVDDGLTYAMHRNAVWHMCISDISDKSYKSYISIYYISDINDKCACASTRLCVKDICLWMGTQNHKV
jgi:hypothetical protein